MTALLEEVKQRVAAQNAAEAAKARDEKHAASVKRLELLRGLADGTVDSPEDVLALLPEIGIEADQVQADLETFAKREQLHANLAAYGNPDEAARNAVLAAGQFNREHAAVNVFLGQEAQRYGSMYPAAQNQQKAAEVMRGQLNAIPWPGVTRQEEAAFFRPVPSTVKPKPVDEWQAEKDEARVLLKAAAAILIGIPCIAGHLPQR